MADAESLLTDLAWVFLHCHRMLNQRMTAEGASLARTKLLLYMIDQKGEARAADIAEIFDLAPRTVTEALDGLERDGMIRRDPDPQDRRVKRLSITEPGRAAAAATEPLRRAMTEQAVSVLDADEREALHRLLGKLMASVKDMECEQAGSANRLADGVRPA